MKWKTTGADQVCGCISWMTAASAQTLWETLGIAVEWHRHSSLQTACSTAVAASEDAVIEALLPVSAAAAETAASDFL